MIHPLEKLEILIHRWDRGDLPLPLLADGLDDVLGTVRDSPNPDEESCEEAHEIWGGIEIINSVTLDKGTQLTPEERMKISELLEQFHSVLSRHCPVIPGVPWHGSDTDPRAQG